MNDTNAQVDEVRDEEREPTSAEVLRERRNAAIGGKAVDNDIHFSLPLTKAFPVLLVGAVLSYLASSMGSKLGNQMLFYAGRSRCSLWRRWLCGLSRAARQKRLQPSVMKRSTP